MMKLINKYHILIFSVKQNWLIKSKKLINKVMKFVNKYSDIKNNF